MSYRQGRQSPINIWETREGEDDRQVAMATTEHKAADLVRLANLGISLDDQVEQLAQAIIDLDIGEPSRSEGAIDVAIRLLKGAQLQRLADPEWHLVRYRTQPGLSGFEYDDDGNRLRRVTILEEAPDGGS